MARGISITARQRRGPWRRVAAYGRHGVAAHRAGIGAAAAHRSMKISAAAKRKWRQKMKSEHQKIIRRGGGGVGMAKDVVEEKAARHQRRKSKAAAAASCWRRKCRGACVAAVKHHLQSALWQCGSISKWPPSGCIDAVILGVP